MAVLEQVLMSLLLSLSSRRKQQQALQNWQVLLLKAQVEVVASLLLLSELFWACPSGQHMPQHGGGPLGARGPPSLKKLCLWLCKQQPFFSMIVHTLSQHCTSWLADSPAPASSQLICLHIRM
jgi:hypothetical protein